MKKLLLIAAMAAMAIGASAEDYNFEKVWELTPSSIGLDVAQTRQGFGMNGKFYINDKAAMTIYEVDENGMTGVTFEGGANCGITRDEAGNILVSNAAFPGSWIEATIKVINPTTGETKEYIVPEECGLMGRCDFLGFAKGDFMESGVLYLTGKTPGTELYTPGIAVFTVTDGEVDYDYCYLATCEGISDAQRDNMTVMNYYTDVNGDPAVLYVYRSMSNYVKKMAYDGDNFTGTNIALPGKGACNGTFPFVFDGKEFFLYPRTPNYLNAFAIAEANAEEPLIDVEATIAASGNGYQSNWLNAEVNGNVVTIYQYSPGNNITVYQLSKESVNPSMRGDVDMDGTVGIADVTALIDYILTGDETDKDLIAANCDGDDTIGIADVTAIIDFILNKAW